MSPPAVAIVYPATSTTTDNEDNFGHDEEVNAEPTLDSLHIVVEKNKVLDLTGNRVVGEGQSQGEGEDLRGLKGDFSPLKDDSSRSPKKEPVRPPILPVQRIILSAEDLVLSFGRAGRRRRRVLGR